MVTVQVFRPVAAGSKVMLNVVVPAAAIVLLPGTVLTVKSVPFDNATLVVPVRFSVADPRLVMVNVLTIEPLAAETEPKSVKSAARAVVSPLGITWLLP